MKKFLLLYFSLITIITNSQTYCPQTGTRIFSVGGTGQAGGSIFYDKGVFSGGWRYMERSVVPISTTAVWGCNGTSIPTAVGSAIGTGQTNTQNIITNCPTVGIAAQKCDLYTLNGFNDWFMPSILELNQIGGWGTFSYLSSTEYNAGSAYFINSAGTMTWAAGNKSLNTYRTYAVRNMSLDQGTNKSITQVQFNAINKISTKNSGYDNYYTTDSTKVMPDHTYPLTIKVNTAGTDTIFVSALFDWNGDGDFNDQNENYNLGSTYNQTNGQPSLSPLNIVIPSEVEHIITRMRIITKKNSYASSCETDFDGEVEDYRVRIYPQLTGYVFSDFSENCIKDVGEIGLLNRSLIIQPGNIIVQSNTNGQWQADHLAIGSYTITLDTTNSIWDPTCSVSQSFSVVDDMVSSAGPNAGLVSTMPCTSPFISIHSNVLRRCMNATIYVQACNLASASGPLLNSYADIELDNRLAIGSTTLPYTVLGSNSFRFQLDTINPGECISFSIGVFVSCSASNGQTLCMNAALFPADSCVFDTIANTDNPDVPSYWTSGGCTIPWDHSSLSVDGWCLNDTVYFSVTNTGSFGGGDMLCYSPISVYVDGVLTVFDSIQIVGGATQIYSFPGNGQTWILQTEQHPLHPGSSHPNAHVEACGDTLNWTPDIVNDLPLDDIDPVIDEFCRAITGPVDPNEKTGYPSGLTSSHFIHSNQPLGYVIDFQNVGTASAINVVIRDTLDINLNIFSVVTGVSSHPYTFRIFGPRVLEWTFENILLPDSTANEPGSHGFVTYEVNQNPNLPNGTIIFNDADIFFDFEAPITTNQTFHEINDATQPDLTTGIISVDQILNSLIVFPNPTNTLLNINTKSNYKTIEVINTLGQILLTKENSFVINVSSISSGIYFIQLFDAKGSLVGREKFIKE